MNTAVNEAAQNAAILFADVAGSTRLYETLGDSQALSCVQNCITRLWDATNRCGGEVIKTIGDEVMCVFRDSAAALAAASEMQCAVRDLPTTGGVRPAVRIGFHYGPVLRQGGDAFGDTVNVAARITALARAHQILASDAAYRALPNHLRIAARPLGGVALKGRNAEVGLCEILWDGAEDMTLMETMPPTERRVMPASRLLLFQGTREWTLESGTLGIGRGDTNEVVVQAPKASRYHARIERRGDRFVLTDLSSNGTFVLKDGTEMIPVRREELVLRGEGLIGLGESDPVAGPSTLGFRLEA
ncbi:MAG: adenylate/guanylate cyclase domain-containing protein [Burkholderiales bacterium]|nr:adenylate/guanylate cyclase domain-containing protein [Burkholderiales bacterium]